jgi:hypothetical protein
VAERQSLCAEAAGAVETRITGIAAAVRFGGWFDGGPTFRLGETTTVRFALATYPAHGTCEIIFRDGPPSKRNENRSFYAFITASRSVRKVSNGESRSVRAENPSAVTLLSSALFSS